MKAPPAYFFRIIGLVTLSALLVLAPATRANESNPFPPQSPEHAALTAASAYLANEDFMLREDYWQGSVTAQTGKAVRLQFFKGNTYRFFLAIEAEKANASTSLSMRIYDTQSREVAATKAEPAQPAVALTFQPKATGLYLVLMGVELAEGVNPYREYPAVLFYGFE